MNPTIKLAIIDGDGVAWDNSARMEVADSAAALVAKALEQFPDNGEGWRINDARWTVAFLPEMVKLDWPMFAVHEHLTLLREAGWTIIILSSNPETTREARCAWMQQHTLVYTLTLKNYAVDRYVSTPDWKVKQVQKLIDEYGGAAAIDCLLFVDDSEKNRNAIMEAFGTDPEMSLLVTNSLDVAIPLVEPKLGASKDFQYRINPEG